MAFCALGIESRQLHRVHHPMDPADFHRCLVLLEQVPQVRQAFPRIAELSPQWRAIIDHWDELEELFLREAGMYWSKSDRAPETFRRMVAILDGVEH